MDERKRKSPDNPNLAAFEGNLFGALFAFHKNVTDLLRNSGLDDDKLTLILARIEQLLDEAASEVKRTKNLDLARSLESAYEELKSMVDELRSTSQ
jgi:hypothetical protein